MTLDRRALDHFHYDDLTRNALRGVIRTVLGEVAAHGLPGAHALYLTFDVNAHGVVISASLRALYPRYMTVVLQHQFWDLAVDDGGFGVLLTFDGVPERLRVPFDALASFTDPSVSWNVHFDPVDQSQDPPPPECATAGGRQPSSTPLAPSATILDFRRRDDGDDDPEAA